MSNQQTNSHHIRVLIADDLELVREGRLLQFQRYTSIKIVGAVGVAKDVVGAIKQLGPDIVLLDLKWGSSSHAGVKILERIREQHLPVKVILLTSHPALLETNPVGRSLADSVVLSDLSTEALVAEMNRLMVVPAPTVKQQLSLAQVLGIVGATFLGVTATIVLLVTLFGGQNLPGIVYAVVLVSVLIVILAFFYLNRLNSRQLGQLIKQLFGWKP